MSYDRTLEALIDAAINGNPYLTNKSIRTRTPKLLFNKTIKPWEGECVPVAAKLVKDNRTIRSKRPPAIRNTKLGGRRINQG